MRQMIQEGPEATGMYNEFRFFLPKDSALRQKVTLDYGSEEPSSENTASALNALYDVEFVILRNKILGAVEHYEGAVQQQYYSADQEAASFLKWINPSVLSKNFVGIDTEPDYENATFWVKFSCLLKGSFNSL